jgi:hypothetical protein
VLPFAKVQFAFDLAREPFHFTYSLPVRQVSRSPSAGFCCAKIAVIACGKSSLTLSADHFCRLEIRNDSSEMIRSRLHSSVHALGDEIQDSYQRRD